MLSAARAPNQEEALKHHTINPSRHDWGTTSIGELLSFFFLLRQRSNINQLSYNWGT